MAAFDKSSPSSLSMINELFFFALGLSLGFMIGFYDLHTLPSTAFSSTSSLFRVEQPLPPPLPPIPLSNPPPPPFPAPKKSRSHETTMNNTKTSFPIEEEGEGLLKHHMSDEELLRKASNVDQLKEMSRVSVPKVAFMFLTRGSLPMAPLWELFFKRHKGLYSIYVHAHPSYNDPYPRGSVFHGRFIPSKEVQWGSLTMVTAERRLLANALLDPSNQRFVLLSESCIPIFNFTTIYHYLMDSTLSFLHSFYSPSPDVGGRYNPKMSPIVNITNWRKGSQWFEAHRDLAIRIVSDRVYIDVFEKHFANRYSDEHYLPTLVNINYPSLICNRTVTFADWRKRSAHPETFGGERVTEKLIDSIRFGSNCTYNGVETNTCFLFARKFRPSSLGPLLRVLDL